MGRCPIHHQERYGVAGVFKVTRNLSSWTEEAGCPLCPQAKNFEDVPDENSKILELLGTVQKGKRMAGSLKNALIKLGVGEGPSSEGGADDATYVEVRRGRREERERSRPLTERTLSLR